MKCTVNRMTFTCQEKIFAVPERDFTIPDVRSSKRFVVTTERTALAQMLWDLKESGDGLSLSKMVARSGGLVAVSTLHDVMHGNSKELTPDTVTGVARILGITETAVLAALRNKPIGNEDPLDLRVLFDGWDEATDEERAATLDDLKMIAERFQRRRKSRSENGAGTKKGRAKK